MNSVFAALKQNLSQAETAWVSGLLSLAAAQAAVPAGSQARMPAETQACMPVGSQACMPAG